MDITEIPEEGISLAPTEDSDKKPREKPIISAAAEFMGDPDVWANYENEHLAEVETMLREWMEDMSSTSTWKIRSSKYRRYTFSMIYQLITGRKFDSKRDMWEVRTWTALLKYYSSRVQKAGSINGRTYSKTIYVLSPARLKRMPFSIRLRIPWLIEHGYEISKRTIVNPCTDLVEPGHARNPRTEENMRKRREEGRKRYERRDREEKEEL